MTNRPRFTDLTNPFQRARSMAGISQHALADILGVGQPAISGYETEEGRFPEIRAAKRFVLWCRKNKIRMDLDEVYEKLEG